MVMVTGIRMEMLCKLKETVSNDMCNISESKRNPVNLYNCIGEDV